MNKTSLLELAKKLNTPRRNCMKTKEELEKAIKDTMAKFGKEIIFDPDNRVCMTCLDEHRKQQVIDKKVYDKKLINDMLGTRLERDSKKYCDGWWHNDRQENRWSVGSWSWFHMLAKQILWVDFIVFADHKITWCKVEGSYILNGTDTLDTWSICDFS